MCSVGKCVTQMKMSCLQVTAFLIESTLFTLNLPSLSTCLWLMAPPFPGQELPTLFCQKNKNPAQLCSFLPFAAEVVSIASQLLHLTSASLHYLGSPAGTGAKTPKLSARPGTEAVIMRSCLPDPSVCRVLWP